MLINLTNDDWFGKTAERYPHFALTVPRAIEHRVPFVRSTLTGVSAFVDANGRIINETTYHDPETLLWDVPLLSSQTIYQRIGDLFPGAVSPLHWWRSSGESAQAVLTAPIAPPLRSLLRAEV